MKATAEQCAAADATFRRLYCGENAPDLPEGWDNPIDDPGASDVTMTPTTQGPAPGTDTPAQPGGPGRSTAWGEDLLAWLFGDEPADAASTNPKPGGCCPGEPSCLKCWLKRHRGWLLIIGLAALAVALKKRP